MVLAGDLNMHKQEDLPSAHSIWEDAWVVAGAKEEDAGTWCPDHLAVDDDAVCKWRFDRVLFRAKGLSLQTAAVAQSSVEAVEGVSLQTTAAVAAGLSPTEEGRGLSLQAALASGLDGARGEKGTEGVSLQTAAVASSDVGRGSVEEVEGVSLQTTTALAAGSFLSTTKVSEGTEEGQGLSLQTALASGVRGERAGVSLQAAAPSSRHVVQKETLLLSEFNRMFEMFEGMDHAMVAADFWVVGGAIDSSELKEERLKVLQAGIGPKVAKRPGAKDSCVRKQHQQVYCGKDYEKPRMLPGRGCILEDPRRKALFRLYTRRNCHHMNTHDPLKPMGLVANVDDQVVLTVQAAVNYLTKYLGKLGGGHTASGRIGGLIDDIISKMQDTETMSVASLLSKLFIHAAVPEDICSLEAWHVLFDLPRVLSSRYIVTVNAKDEKATASKSFNEIEAGTQETIVSKPTKLDIYLDRTTAKRSAELTYELLQQMSYVQFVSQVDRRGQNLSLRKKANIVKEKPFLQLDARRRDAADVARACLRLHRPFDTKAEDPMQLPDAAAMAELRKFVTAETCPGWLRQRYAKHNRQKRKKGAPAGMSVLGGGLTLQSAADSQAGEGGLTLQSAAPQASHTGLTLQSAESSDAPASHSTLTLQSGETQASGSTLTLQSGEMQVGDRDVGVEAVPVAKRRRVTERAVTMLQDTRENRIAVARAHDLLWWPEKRKMVYSITEACKKHTPRPRAAQVRGYLAALCGKESKKSSKLVELMEALVFTVLALDLEPFQKRGGGVQKTGLSKQSLVKGAEVYFQFRGNASSPKEKREALGAPYAVLWNLLKRGILRDCGLQVSLAEQHRIRMGSDSDLRAEERSGQWREGVFCLDPNRNEEEEWEKAEEREAKRIRSVKSPMYEQSMGPPGGSRLYEVDVPYDPDALMCVDKDSCAEWDALNPFQKLLGSEMLQEEMGQLLVEETDRLILKPSQGGIPHTEAAALVADASGGAGVVQQMDLDPTQASFVDHMEAWLAACSQQADRMEKNLPALVSADGGGENVAALVSADGDKATLAQLLEPILLLGTAGTGKTTTIQAANARLVEKGLAGGRIMRAAFTGVAASNMGTGGRTLMSLFRLAKQVVGGVLPALSKEELEKMDAELGRLAVLEIDELSMLEKSVLAHVQMRLQQWRYEVYHPVHCKGEGKVCQCGARMLFGGVKVVLAGDFGQLPPVAVAAERTLLFGKCVQGGQGKAEVNVGLRLFQGIRNVIRLRRIHRQVGQSSYKESLLRLRDLAHTKEDVALWRSQTRIAVSAHKRELHSKKSECTCSARTNVLGSSTVSA